VLSYARLYDEATIRDAYYPYRFDGLNKVFSDRQLMKIENEFETPLVNTPAETEKKLVAIMRNIVRNEGTFKP